MCERLPGASKVTWVHLNKNTRHHCERMWSTPFHPFQEWLLVHFLLHPRMPDQWLAFEDTHRISCASSSSPFDIQLRSNRCTCRPCNASNWCRLRLPSCRSWRKCRRALDPWRCLIISSRYRLFLYQQAKYKSSLGAKYGMIPTVDLP